MISAKFVFWKTLKPNTLISVASSDLSPYLHGNVLSRASDCWNYYCPPAQSTKLVKVHLTVFMPQDNACYFIRNSYINYNLSHFGLLLFFQLCFAFWVCQQQREELNLPIFFGP